MSFLQMSAVALMTRLCHPDRYTEDSRVLTILARNLISPDQSSRSRFDRFVRIRQKKAPLLIALPHNPFDLRCKQSNSSCKMSAAGSAACWPR